MQDNPRKLMIKLLLKKRQALLDTARPTNPPWEGSRLPEPATTPSSTMTSEMRNMEKYNRHLCLKCRNVFHKWFEQWTRAHYSREERFRFTHHRMIQLKKSAKDGCPVCTLVFDRLDKDTFRLLRLGKAKDKGFARFEASSGKVPDIELEFTFEAGKKVIECVMLRLAYAGPGPSQIGGISLPSTTTDCYQTWTLAKKWIDGCVTTHEKCTTPVDGFLPTRLIDVGTTDYDICLCLSKDLQSDVKYFTLSHCWGKLEIEILTSRNLSSMLEHIPWETLSKTFKDAIIITRRLGFRYLWIDSLCIVQNSPDDWQEESAVMGRVYRSSSLNIAASDAPDGNTGCFFTRTAGDMHGCKILAQAENIRSETFNCMPYIYEDRRTSHSIVAKRGWVFQERFLAPRTLYFSRSELTWECRENSASETFPDTIELYRKTVSSKFSDLDPTLSQRSNFIRSWFKIVSSYSTLNLTFSTDKLVALSGITSMFAAKYNLTYVAGLWKEALEHQLGWTIEQGHGPRPELYQAPSWSWASVHGQAVLTSGLTCTKLYVTVQDVSVELVGPNMYGQVSHGLLRLRCMDPIPVTIRPDKVIDDKDIDDKDADWEDIDEDGSAIEELDDEDSNYPDYPGMADSFMDDFRLSIEGSEIPMAFIDPDTQSNELKSEVHLVLLGSYDRKDSASPHDREHGKVLKGLLLRPCAENLFRRIGVFEVDEGIAEFESIIAERGLCRGKSTSTQLVEFDPNSEDACIITVI